LPADGILHPHRCESRLWHSGAVKNRVPAGWLVLMWRATFSRVSLKHVTLQQTVYRKVGFNEAAPRSATLIGTTLDKEAGVILIPL
jgi:hypothetical protein